MFSSANFSVTQNQVIDLYIAPVSRKLNPNLFADSLLILDLPEPLGPSTAITIFGRVKLLAFIIAPNLV